MEKKTWSEIQSNFMEQRRMNVHGDSSLQHKILWDAYTE